MERELKPFLEDMLSMSTSTDGRTLQIYFSRPVTKEDRQAIADAHNAIVRGQITAPPQSRMMATPSTPNSGETR